MAELPMKYTLTLPDDAYPYSFVPCRYEMYLEMD